MSSTNIFGGRRWCTLSIHGRAKSARGGEALRSAQPLGLEPPNLASRGGPRKLGAEGREGGINSYPRRKGERPLQVSIAVLWPHASTAGRFFKVRPLRFLCQAQFSRSSVIWRGSCCSSPRSTFLTMSTRRSLARRGDADLLAFAHDKAVQEFDLSAPALHHVLAHRRPLIGRAAPDPRQPPLVIGFERFGIA